MHRPPGRLWTLGVRVPAAEADRLERRRFVRDLNARSAIVTACALIIAFAIGAAGWVIALIAVGILAVLVDVAWLSLTLARDRETSG